METKISAVIGAWYGDEGKGQMVNRITAQSFGNTLNVLYNGGCQRGHTVVKGNVRHVFHCFGSGTLYGADTYWTKDFLVDPYAVSIEYKDVKPNKILCHPEARVVTPYDIALNQIKERSRNGSKHGSCGMGIFETIERNKEIPVRVKDLYCVNFKSLMDKVEERFYRVVQPYGNFAVNDRLISDFYDAVKSLKTIIEFDESIPFNSYKNVIFEGGQGLALSQSNLKDFPYLTPSYTGSENIIKELGSKAEYGDVTLYYVTRPYVTRHGAGPFPTENRFVKKYVPKELTNVSNEWQDNFRYGTFDFDVLKERIEKDKSLWPVRQNSVLAVTQAVFGSGFVVKADEEEYVLDFLPSGDFVDRTERYIGEAV